MGSVAATEVTEDWGKTFQPMIFNPAREFIGWPKTPRLFKPIVITEKIDGTNGAVVITDDGDVYAQSRTRLISIHDDNHGFARWVYDNSFGLRETLGPGRHFGEWWGWRINRGYSCKQGERYFSLFNTKKWGYLTQEESPVPGLTVVPTIFTGIFDTALVMEAAAWLKETGSFAKPGFDRPEGLCLFHEASGQIYKYPFDKYSMADGF